VARLAVLGTSLAAMLFLAGTYVAPLLESSGLPGGDWIRRFYAPVCHQFPPRCFEIGGFAQAVCARCAGLYWGGVVGLFASTWLVARRRRGPRPIWLAVAFAPTAVDALLPWIGRPGLSAVPRHILAWPAGLVAALFLAVGVADLATSLVSKRARRPDRLGANSVLEGSDG
jgi:uncharacterized membrane protein